MKRRRRYLLAAAGIVALAVMISLSPSMVEHWAYAAARGATQANRELLVKLSEKEQLSTLFRTVAKIVKPAVVVIRVKKRVLLPESRFDSDELMRRFFGEDDGFGFRRRTPRSPRERMWIRRGLGSGVIVDAKNGYVLTNDHVAGDADEVEVILADGRTFQAQWVRSDSHTDLAVVKIKPGRLSEAALGDSDKAEVGDLVLAIGAPERLPQTVTAGIISAKERRTGSRLYENFIQTDAAINHGNSGGPLVNMRGEIIGINAAIVSRTGVNEGIGLAIPSNMARNVMRQLVDTGKVVRGYLGVTIQDVNEKLAKSFGLPHSRGALVIEPAKGGPAEKAGVKAEDFIVAIDGEPVANVNELLHSVANLVPGSEVKITVYRAGKERTVPLKVASRPEDETVARRPGRERTETGKYGLRVRTLTKELARTSGFDEGASGVLIVNVDQDSDAAEQGLRPGMLVERVNGRKIATTKDFGEAVAAAKGKSIRLRVAISGVGRRYFVVSPK